MSIARDDGTRGACEAGATDIARLLTAGRVRAAEARSVRLELAHRIDCGPNLVRKLTPFLRDTRRAVREFAVDCVPPSMKHAATRARCEALAAERDPELRAKTLEGWLNQPSTCLIPFLRSRDPAERRLAADALGRQRVVEAVPMLASALDDPAVAVAAAEALGEIGDPRALPSLIRFFERSRGATFEHDAVALHSIAQSAGMEAVVYLAQVATGPDKWWTTRWEAVNAVSWAVAPVAAVPRVRELVTGVAKASP